MVGTLAMEDTLGATPATIRIMEMVATATRVAIMVDANSNGVLKVDVREVVHREW